MALAEGRAFADLSDWRKVAVSGGDGLEWLEDLVSAEVADLQVGSSRRSLLLSPTGHVRAEFTVAMAEDGILLIQDPQQASSVADLLSPYVLSSDVGLSDRTSQLALFAVPGGPGPARVAGAGGWAPSCLGGGGRDIVADRAEAAAVRGALKAGLIEATPDDVERWRVWAGLPRAALDARPDDLPQETGLGEAVAFDKGCYLGQEAMARVRNFGHPRRVLLPFETAEPVERGQAVFADGGEVGVITSAVRAGSRTLILAKVRWDAREGALRTTGGVELRPRTVPAVPDG